jgi:TPR repeat protein
MLFFIILDKEQPIYEDNLKKEAIENILSNSSISASELEEFLSLKFRDSTNYEYSIKRLAKSGNPYACYELGTQEYYGYMAGYSRYDISYNYLKVAADLGHPGANYLIATMFLKKRIGAGNDLELELAFDYLNKAIKYGSIEAINTMGLLYLKGVHLVTKNKEKAIQYFEKAIKYDYVYAYNNLGRIYEEDKSYDKAFQCYLSSANLGESWACNKVGEYYRLGISTDKDMKLAYKYYNLALDCNYKNICYYAKYNLAKYFYLEGCTDIVLVKDKERAISYLEDASNNGIIEASIELLYIYSDLYLKNNDNNLWEIINTLVKVVETNNKYNDKLKKDIENKLKEIKKNNHIDLNIIKNHN